MSENKNTTEGMDASQPQTQRKRKRWPITLGIIAVIVVIAGAGMWVWHEQPSFCNAFCHTPMDPYLPTYEAEPGQATHDKWGNEVADGAAMLAATHRANTECNATCMSCHVPTIGEQVAEFGSFVGGGYNVVDIADEGNSQDYSLIERTLDELVAARGLESGDQFCLNEACHNLTRDDLAATTAEYDINPHVAQHEELSCDTCHKAHRASANHCGKCHADAPTPEGWISADQEQELQRRAE